MLNSQYHRQVYTPLCPKNAFISPLDLLQNMWLSAPYSSVYVVSDVLCVLSLLLNSNFIAFAIRNKACMAKILYLWNLLRLILWSNLWYNLKIFFPYVLKNVQKRCELWFLFAFSLSPCLDVYTHTHTYIIHIYYNRLYKIYMHYLWSHLCRHLCKHFKNLCYLDFWGLFSKLYLLLLCMGILPTQSSVFCVFLQPSGVRGRR